MTNPIKPTLKTEIFPIILILAAAIASFYFYAHFPERVPTHWNFAGQVNGWGNKVEGAFAIPVMLIFMYFLFLFLPMLDPKKERYEQFIKTYNIFRNLILLVLVAIYFIASLNGLGHNVPVQYLVPIIIGVLFIVLGNYMGKLKRNWFIGVRTPWTISSEEVWNKTNRFGGYLFMLSGLIMMAIPFLPSLLGLWLFGGMMVALVFGTFVYSYVLYIKEKSNAKNNQSTKS
jgi:uncharacterized membrane protein